MDGKAAVALIQYDNEISLRLPVKEILNDEEIQN